MVLLHPVEITRPVQLLQTHRHVACLLFARRY
jgi:hypothetical protein